MDNIKETVERMNYLTNYGYYGRQMQINESEIISEAAAGWFKQLATNSVKRLRIAAAGVKTISNYEKTYLPRLKKLAEMSNGPASQQGLKSMYLKEIANEAKYTSKRMKAIAREKQLAIKETLKGAHPGFTITKTGQIKSMGGMKGLTSMERSAKLAARAEKAATKGQQTLQMQGATIKDSVIVMTQTGKVDVNSIKQVSKMKRTTGPVFKLFDTNGGYIAWFRTKSARDAAMKEGSKYYTRVAKTNIHIEKTLYQRITNIFINVNKQQKTTITNLTKAGKWERLVIWFNKWKWRAVIGTTALGILMFGGLAWLFSLWDSTAKKDGSGGGGGVVPGPSPTPGRTERKKVIISGDKPEWQWEEAGKNFSPGLNEKFKKALADHGISFGAAAQTIPESRLTFMGILAEQAVADAEAEAVARPSEVDITEALKKYGGYHEGHTYHYFENGDELPYIEKRKGGNVVATYKTTNMEIQTTVIPGEEGEDDGSGSGGQSVPCTGGCLSDRGDEVTLEILSAHKKQNPADYKDNYHNLRPVEMEERLPLVHKEIMEDLFGTISNNDQPFDDLGSTMSIVGEPELIYVHDIVKKYADLGLLEQLDYYFRAKISDDGIEDDTLDADWTGGDVRDDSGQVTGSIRELKDDIVKWFSSCGDYCEKGRR